eukprot:NODE_3215_length_583_cov_95.486891_g2701_i0.p1 GENE.NODE_3215_length_583_cov_95.486891_g2701_i0~~NODE_3215_length_583_cov_95.486891_g2701_i0.p1  ORF type:complete len:155 (+),score=21.10 NODE_3215_length_583_cov_95.486891_g2701_i0:58-522(+)
MYGAPQPVAYATYAHPQPEAPTYIGAAAMQYPPTEIAPTYVGQAAHTYSQGQLAPGTRVILRGRVPSLQNIGIVEGWNNGYVVRFPTIHFCARYTYQPDMLIPVPDDFPRIPHNLTRDVAPPTPEFTKAPVQQKVVRPYSILSSVTGWGDQYQN